MIDREHPSFCARQARRTPTIPTHNGYPRCLACGRGLTVIDHDGKRVVTAQPGGPVRTDYTAPGVEPYWDREAGSASSLLLLAGLIPLVFVVWFLAHVAGAVATVGGVQ